MALGPAGPELVKRRGDPPGIRRTVHIPRRVRRARPGQPGGAYPRGDGHHRGRRPEPRGARPVVAGASHLSPGCAFRRYGALLGRSALGGRRPRLARGPARADAQAGAVAEGGVSAACPEDHRHGAACHGTPRRGFSDGGHGARAVLEVRRGRRGHRRWSASRLCSDWPTSSRIRSKPSWPTCTGWSAGSRSPASWGSWWCWASACGDGNGVSRRRSLRGNGPRRLQFARDSRFQMPPPARSRWTPRPSDPSEPLRNLGRVPSADPRGCGRRIPSNHAISPDECPFGHLGSGVDLALHTL